MQDMKRLGMTALAALLLAGGLTACSRTPGGSSAPSGSAAPTQGKGTLRMGLEVEADYTADAEGAQLHALAAAVLVDGDGRITACRLDEWELNPKTENGVLASVTDRRTKGERGDSYGMKAASPIGREWYEQVDAFCRYVVGKTADEVAAVPLQDGKAADTDLAASCTVTVTGFLRVTERAVRGAAPCDAAAADSLRLAVTTTQTGSGEETEYSSDIAAVACDAGGRVTDCRLDTLPMALALQDGLPVAGSGSYTTKRQKGDAYGMKAVSPIGREWYEQADTLQQALRGKTAEEIRAMPLQDGKAADLKSGCTITVSGLLETAVKALEQTR